MVMEEITNDEVKAGDSNLMGTKDGMFVRQYHFDPLQHQFSSEDLITILKLLNMALSPAVFDQLPEHTKRHFVEINRKGERKRYGQRQRRG